jgi:hypothetical protein
MADIENFKSDVLPYDFVKENEVIVAETEHGYLALSPYQLTITLYQDILNQILNSKYAALISLMSF